MNHSERIPINFASSGQQEVLWLLESIIYIDVKKGKGICNY